LSQLNREAEKAKCEPRLSALRESGAIEQNVYIILMLLKYKDRDGSQENLLDIVPRDLINVKQRNDPIEVVSQAFRKNLTRFYNCAQENNS
jgi:replicative DNA helicase